MILAARGGLNHSLSRGASGGSSIGINAWRPRGKGDPVGLPAVANAVRLISGTIGSFIMRPYSGDASKRQPMLTAPQAIPLQDAAPGYCTSMDLWRAVSTSVLLDGFGLIWKGRDGTNRVAELYPFPTEACCIYVTDQGQRVVEATVRGKRIDITRDVIVVNGWSPFVSVEGVSTTRLHRRTLDGMHAMQEFRGRYFDSDATPNLVIIAPGNVNEKQREEFRESWAARHSGPQGEKMGLLWGDAKVQQLASTLEQAQLAELMNSDAATVAQMFRIYPPSLIASTVAIPLPTAENVSQLFLRFTLLERLREIERAVSADRDLFPDRNVYANFDVGKFTAGDTATVAGKIHQLIQVGAMTPNEGRAELGYSPSNEPGADTLLVTPVGAGPNGDASGGAASAPTSDEPDDGGGSASGTTSAKVARSLSAAETLQKIYLAVDKVITVDEARSIANAAGAGLAAETPPFATPSPAPEPAADAPDPGDAPNG